MRAIVSITYEVTTPYLTAQGDFADAGFEVERRPIERGELRRLIEEFRGCVEPSSSPVMRPGDWWTTEGSTDYRTGEVTRRSLYIDGVTAATFQRIDRALRPERS